MDWTRGQAPMHWALSNWMTQPHDHLTIVHWPTTFDNFEGRSSKVLQFCLPQITAYQGSLDSLVTTVCEVSLGHTVITMTVSDENIIIVSQALSSPL